MRLVRKQDALPEGQIRTSHKLKLTSTRNFSNHSDARVVRPWRWRGMGSCRFPVPKSHFGMVARSLNGASGVHVTCCAGAAVAGPGHTVVEANCSKCT